MKNTSENHLHIISFDIPFPANYGGVIDVFYKLKHLHNQGIKVILHCYRYGNRHVEAELLKFCQEVHYYDRKSGFFQQLSITPFIVKSRTNDLLLKNLMADDYPILFEGLHSCGYLDHPALHNRFKVYRESNIEHHYYQHLAKSTSRFSEKIFFTVESIRLRLFQNKLQYANLMLTVSKADTDYLKVQFPHKNIQYLPSFHPNDSITSVQGKGDYALYHGKLSVAENLIAAEYLIKEVFAQNSHQFIIAGMNPPRELKKLVSLHKNVELIENPVDETLFSLIANAHINVLVTFQPTGLKLKLLNTLFKGRFCLVNPAMLAGTDLRSFCEVAENTQEMVQMIENLFSRNFDVNEIAKRRNLLSAGFSNAENAKKLTELIFG